jgi:UDPglucose 6-dehydrogenase
MDILMVGAGYAGLISAVCLASRGHKVSIYDKDESKMSSIMRGDPPFFENGLEPMLRGLVSSGSILPIRSMADGVRGSDVIFICVGTPQKPDGSAELSHVESACDELSSILKTAVGRKLIVIRSTVPPGATARLAARISSASSLSCPDDFGIAMNPEFMRQGNAIDDFLRTNQVILGVEDGRDAAALAEVYSRIRAPVVVSIRAAEMSKYVYNCMLANQISFINEMGLVGKGLGVDIGDVVRALDLRIGMPGSTIKAGCGFGGSCLEKDTLALSGIARTGGIEPRMMASSIKVNDSMLALMLDILAKRMGGVSGRRIGVLGLSFKQGTDDTRNSRSLALIGLLAKRGALVSAYDPQAGRKAKDVFPEISILGSPQEAIDSCEAVAILTDWPEFSLLDFKDRIVVDGRGVVPKEKRGKNYEGICWP